MTHLSPSSAADDPLPRAMREICVQATEAAEAAVLLRPLLLLIAQLLTRLFGCLEDLFVLWRAGNLPEPPVRAPRPATRRSRPRRNRARRRATKRPTHVRRTAIRDTYFVFTAPIPPSGAPAPRIDRYPKTA